MIKKLNLLIGQKASYLILSMVFLTFGIVVLRYTFSFGKVWLQELVVYMHAGFFMLGMTYTFLKDKHVRVDVFYSFFSQKTKDWINLLGHLMFTLPVGILIFIKSLPYVQQSFAVLESSPDAEGLPARFLLKALIPIFCSLIILHVLSDSFNLIRAKLKKQKPELKNQEQV